LDAGVKKFGKVDAATMPKGECFHIIGGRLCGCLIDRGYLYPMIKLL
jgi:hypothetical protein